MPPVWTAVACVLVLSAPAVAAAQPTRPTDAGVTVSPDGGAEPSLRSFLPEFCKRLARRDLAFVRLHVSLPLRIRVIVDEGGGNPVYGTRTLASAEAVVGARLCEGVGGIEPGASPEALRVARTPHGWSVETSIGQFSLRMEFERTPAGPRLVLYRVE